MRGPCQAETGGQGAAAPSGSTARSPQDADPDLAADLAAALLTGQAGPQPLLGSGHQRENITFKDIVGLELKARGLDVELAVYCDETAFDTFTEIIAAVPGPGDGGGQVCVTDDGGLTWTRDYLAETAAMVSAPERCGQVADPASIASSVVEAVTRAISLDRRRSRCIKALRCREASSQWEAICNHRHNQTGAA